MIWLQHEQMDVELNNHILLHFDIDLHIVEDKNFLDELIYEFEDRYVEDEHDNVLNVMKSNMRILMNQLEIE